MDRPLLVVDAANVVGSVPDGWWRDRAGATERLLDALVELAREGTSEIVLVVEGAARRVAGRSEVRVVATEHSGDDAIVEVIRAEVGRRACTVVTADRELRARVTALGAAVTGPRAVRPGT